MNGLAIGVTNIISEFDQAKTVHYEHITIAVAILLECCIKHVLPFVISTYSSSVTFGNTCLTAINRRTSEEEYNQSEFSADTFKAFLDRVIVQYMHHQHGDGNEHENKVTSNSTQEEEDSNEQTLQYFELFIERQNFGYEWVFMKYATLIEKYTEGRANDTNMNFALDKVFSLFIHSGLIETSKQTFIEDFVVDSVQRQTSAYVAFVSKVKQTMINDIFGDIWCQFARSKEYIYFKKMGIILGNDSNSHFVMVPSEVSQQTKRVSIELQDQ